MSQGISLYSAEHLLTYSLSQNTYLALTLTPVTSDMDGTNLIEPNPMEYPNYTRVLLLPNTWNAPVSVELVDEEGEFSHTSSISNTELIQFICPNSFSGAMMVVGWAILDSLNAGHVLYFGTIPPTLISSGITPYFDIETLIITIN